MASWGDGDLNALPNFDWLAVDSDGDGIDDDTEFGSTYTISSTSLDSDGDGYNG